MRELDGRTVLVTGGSRGIGGAIARGMADAGANVVVHYCRDPGAARATAETLGESRCLLVRADFDDPGQIAALWDAAVAWKGRVDVVVNNAGIFEPVAMDAGDDAWLACWRRTLQVNLVAAAQLCRAAIAHYRANGGGILVNIASRAAFRGDDPDYLHYAASKGGMVSLTKSIARGYGADKVLAYTIAPGFVLTEMSEDYVRRYGDAHILADLPLGEMAAPEDVANVAVFLASGKARHATGTTIDVNGASYVR